MKKRHNNTEDISANYESMLDDEPHQHSVASPKREYSNRQEGYFEPYRIIVFLLPDESSCHVIGNISKILQPWNNYYFILRIFLIIRQNLNLDFIWKKRETLIKLFYKNWSQFKFFDLIMVLVSFRYGRSVVYPTTLQSSTGDFGVRGYSFCSQLWKGDCFPPVPLKLSCMTSP